MGHNLLAQSRPGLAVGAPAISRWRCCWLPPAVAAWGSPVRGVVTLHALFMKQAAYSEQDVKAMTDAFSAVNPNVTVIPEYVAYDALHDKIVTDQVAGAPASTTSS